MEEIKYKVRYKDGSEYDGKCPAFMYMEFYSYAYKGIDRTSTTKEIDCITIYTTNGEAIVRPLDELASRCPELNNDLDKFFSIFLKKY